VPVPSARGRARRSGDRAPRIAPVGVRAAPDRGRTSGRRGRLSARAPVYLRGMAEQAQSLGSVDFSTHVLSLASTALIALGKMPGPDDEIAPVDLETARHLIDVLGMLEHKTKGNLDESEHKLLQSLIYDLRVSYVDAEKAKHG
jgi:Domain of unknown function (DUF1844)